MSAEDQSLAATLGIDPNEPGLADRIGSLANRFTSAIGGVFNRGKEATFESQLLALKRNPGDRATKEWLFANSVGNPERMARIQAEFGGSHEH